MADAQSPAEPREREAASVCASSASTSCAPVGPTRRSTATASRSPVLVVVVVVVPAVSPAKGPARLSSVVDGPRSRTIVEVAGAPAPEDRRRAPATRLRELAADEADAARGRRGSADEVKGAHLPGVADLHEVEPEPVRLLLGL